MEESEKQAWEEFLGGKEPMQPKDMERRIQQLESELSTSKDRNEAMERVCLSNKQTTKDHLLYIEQLELCISENQEELKKKNQEIEEKDRSIEGLKSIIADSEELKGNNIQEIERLRGKVKEIYYGDNWEEYRKLNNI